MHVKFTMLNTVQLLSSLMIVWFFIAFGNALHSVEVIDFKICGTCSTPTVKFLSREWFFIVILSRLLWHKTHGRG